MMFLPLLYVVGFSLLVFFHLSLQVRFFCNFHFSWCPCLVLLSRLCWPSLMSWILFPSFLFSRRVCTLELSVSYMLGRTWLEAIQAWFSFVKEFLIGFNLLNSYRNIQAFYFLLKHFYCISLEFVSMTFSSVVKFIGMKLFIILFKISAAF